MQAKKYMCVLYYIKFKKSSADKQFFDKCAEKFTQIFFYKNVHIYVNILTAHGIFPCKKRFICI